MITLLLLMMFAGLFAQGELTGLRASLGDDCVRLSDGHYICHDSSDAEFRRELEHIRVAINQVALSAPVRRESRQYHSVAIEKMAANRHTHVEVVGYVTYIKAEEDGDLHIRICSSPRIKGMDRQRCVVGEMTPGCYYRPDARLQGMHIRARGISRFDKEANHNWWEIHPLEGLEILP